MFLALIMVPLFGLFVTGGIGETISSIKSVDPDLLNLLPATATAKRDHFFSCLGIRLFWTASYYRPLYGD